jgi:hypothetical protein
VTLEDISRRNHYCSFFSGLSSHEIKAGENKQGIHVWAIVNARRLSEENTALVDRKNGEP